MNKQNHKNRTHPKKDRLQQKLLLRQTLDSFEFDDFLYPSIPEGARHPFTQEIMLYADEQGWTQSDIAEVCNVSQPTVSEWKNGYGKAQPMQIEALIKKLSPRAPGNNFYLLNVVKVLPEVTLPKDWELEMVSLAYNVDADTILSCNERGIQREVNAELQEHAVRIYDEIRKVEAQEHELDFTHTAYQKEAKRNSEQKERYEREKQALLVENSHYKNLNPEDLEVILEKKLSSILIKKSAEKEFNKFIKKISSSDESYESLSIKLKGKLEELEQEKNSIASQRKDLFEKLWPLKFTNDEIGRKIRLTIGGLVSRDSYVKLYGDTQYYIVYVPYGYYRDEIKRAKINIHDYLSQYIETLPAPFIEEEVQISGKFVANNASNKDGNSLTPYFSHKEGNNGDETFDLLILHSRRLAVIAGTFNKKEDRYLYQMHNYTNLDELLIDLKSRIDSSTLDNWKKLLMEQGYISSTVRLVF